MFFQKDIETMDRKSLESLQLERLKRIVRYCYDNVEFYNKKLKQANVNPDKIKVLSDIQYIPFTTKDDMRNNYPYGLLAAPMRKNVRIHASSGTTGKPTVGFYTKKDLDVWSDQVARVAVGGGATEDDIFQISFGYGLFTGALGLHYGLEKLGATVIPMSSGNTAKQLMMMRDFGVTGLVATPSYALYLGETMKNSEYPRSDYKLRIGVLGSEGCTTQMRDQIEGCWNIFVSDNYGMTELGGPGASGECHLRCGLHFAEDHFLPEIIDTKTGQVKAPGESGELVVTTLTREGMPVLRYRTRDITRLNYEKCECGRTHVRMDKVKGRTDDMMIIKGVNVFPSQIETVLGANELLAAHYQLVLRRKNFMDNLEVKVEVVNGDLLENYRNLKNLQEEVHGKLKSVLGLETKVTLVEPNTLQRFQGKAKRILDLRNETEEQQ